MEHSDLWHFSICRQLRIGRRQGGSMAILKRRREARLRRASRVALNRAYRSGGPGFEGLWFGGGPAFEFEVGVPRP